MEQKTYKITGMSCQGCRKHVEDILSNIEEVNEVKVDLDKAEATISSQNPIPFEKVKAALEADGGSYGIAENDSNEQTYHVSGMSCNGCPSHVQKILSKVDHVTNVEVDLKKAEAKITSDQPVALSTLQKALEENGGSYEISDEPQKKKLNL